MGTPGAGARGAPGGTPGFGPTSGNSAGGGPDLDAWTFWWEFNKEPYLNLRARVHDEGVRSGTDGFFLGWGAKSQGKGTLQPSQEQIRERVVPALLSALEKETNNDIITGCLIALAKIGDAPSETGDSAFEGVIARFLADNNQEISETAAVALGILANPKSIGTLESLLRDDAKGRSRVERREVDYRTRAFAAYGLGLIGHRAGKEEDRQRIVKILRELLETDDTRTRDLRVSCLIAMGLVPLESIEATVAEREKGEPILAESGRVAQLEYMLSYLEDEGQGFLVRAHCPTALARLLVGMPAHLHEAYRERVASALLDRIDPRAHEKDQVVQSSVLALGLIGTNDDGNPLDRRIREALMAVPKKTQNQQARNYSLIALAKMGGTTAPGAKDAEGGVGAITKALLVQLADGKSAIRPWAGLACGVMAEKLAGGSLGAAQISALQQAVRSVLAKEKDPEGVGALAIAAGIMKDVEAKEELMARLLTERDETTLGYVAVSLGLMGAEGAADAINRIVDESKYRPVILKQAAIALSLLGDKGLVPKLAKLLQDSRGMASQASLASALGLIGDKGSIDPLVGMLQNRDLTDPARGFAAVALGIVADKETLPWNTKISVDLNYRASTSTLTDAVGGTGILDIL